MFENSLLSKSELKALPKVELHLHLEGALRIATIQELSKSTDSKYYLKEPTDSLDAFIDNFWHVQALLDDPKVIQRVTVEAIQDAYSDGVRVLELRYSPSFITSSRYSDHSHLTFQSVHNAVMQGVSEAVQLLQNDIHVGIIGILSGLHSIEQANELLDFMILNRSDFRGIDIAGSECFDIAKFVPVYERAKDNGFGLTVHSGESTTPDHIWEALKLSPSRIGHGIRAVLDQKLVKYLKDHRIVLEICPISNIYTQSIKSYSEHPIRRLWDQQIPISISSDDPGIFLKSLLDNYDMLQRDHGFSKDDFKAANLMALNSAFLTDAERELLRTKYFQ